MLIFFPLAKHHIAILYLYTICIPLAFPIYFPPQIMSLQQHHGIFVRLGQRKDDALLSPKMTGTRPHKELRAGFTQEPRGF